MNDGYKDEREPHLEPFDESAHVDATDVSNIIVEYSCANVNVFLSDTPDICLHFYGKADMDGKVYFENNVQNGKLYVELRNVGNIHKNQLTFDISIPKDKVFKTISIKSFNDITLGKCISASSITATSIQGSIKSYAEFATAFITSDHSNIELYINPRQNVAFEISTQFGNVSLKFANIANVNLINLEDTTSNHVTNNYKNVSSGFVADVEYKLGCGKMTISNY